jgi:hypothetical protein
MRRQLCAFGIATIFAVMTADSEKAGAALLSIDVNDRTEGEATSDPSNNTAPGFSPFVISGTAPITTTSSVVNGYTVTMTVFDSNGATGGAGAMDDRDRVVPTTAPSLNEVYDDFLFVGNSAGPTGGLDVTISGGALAPTTPYLVSIYAYDGIDANMASATQTRTATWSDGNNADALMFNATFTINMPPTTDGQYKFTGVALTDGAGQLLIKGRRVTAADLAVYVDGLEVDVVPEPTATALLCMACGTIGLIWPVTRQGKSA